MNRRCCMMDGLIDREVHMAALPLSDAEIRETGEASGKWGWR